MKICWGMFLLISMIPIHFVDQHIRDGGVFPEGAGFALRLLIAQTMQSLVLGGVWNTPVIEHPGNRRFTVALGEQGKYLPDNGGFLVNDEMALPVGVLLVAIEGKGPDMKPVFPPVGQDAADIFRHVLQIPLIDQAVDLPGLFVALVGRIRVVHQTDKADAPDREEAVDVPFHQLQFPVKRDWLLHRMMSNLRASASCKRRTNSGRFRSEPV